MTGTASDGAGPALTRAERRRKRSWLQRRRARRSARRRDAERPATKGRRGGAGATPHDAVAAPVPVQPPARTRTAPHEVGATVDAAPEPSPEREPLPVVQAVALPAPDREARPADPVEADRGSTTRRARRRGGRARRKSRSRPIAPASASAPPAAAPPVAPSPVAAPPVPPRGSEPAAVSARRAPSKPARTTRRRAARTGAKAPDAGERRFWTRVMPAIAGLLVVAVVVGAVVRNGEDGDPSRAARGGPSTPVDEQPVLLVHTGANGNDLLAIADRDGAQGTVLLVPVATQLDVPSKGTSVFQDIPTVDAGALLTNSVENEVGVAIGRTVLVDDAALTAALGPAAPFPITLTDPVAFSDRSAKYRAGAQEVSAAQAAELMSAPQAVNELDRLVVVAAVMDGWMDRLRDPAVALATLQQQPGLAPLVAAAGAPDRRLDTVPVTSIATGGGERFDIRSAELAAFVRRAFPSSQLGDHGHRPRVEILNGTGALGVAQAVADKAVPAGGRVVNSDNLPGFGLAETQVVYYSDRWRGSAQAILDAMGCGSLRKAGKDVQIADVTILVGSDCPAYGAPGGGT